MGRMPTAVWDPDWVVAPALAKSLLESSFPELAPVSITEFASGWDNTVFLVNSAFVFRFPRRRIAVPLMETETRLLPWLSRQLTLRIPSPSHIGTPSAEYPNVFAGYPLISGRTITAMRMPNEERRSLAAPLGKFLKELHSVSPDEARSRGASNDPICRLDRHHNAKAIDRLSTFTEDVLPRNVHGQIRSLLDSLPTAEQASTKTLVHGDLHGSQILVDDVTYELAGVIDWGDVHLGDPAADFAAIHSLLPQDCHEAFLREYGPVDRLSWFTAKSRAIRHTIAVLAQAASVKDADTILEARSCLVRLAES
jgi:aminoglycoside phosphotransferase (APT) family kinase protein